MLNCGPGPSRTLSRSPAVAAGLAGAGVVVIGGAPTTAILFRSPATVANCALIQPRPFAAGYAICSQVLSALRPTTSIVAPAASTPTRSNCALGPLRTLRLSLADANGWPPA